MPLKHFGLSILGKQILTSELCEMQNVLKEIVSFGKRAVTITSYSAMQHNEWD